MLIFVHLCHDVTNFGHFLLSVRGHIAPRFQYKWIRGDLVSQNLDRSPGVLVLRLLWEWAEAFRHFDPPPSKGGLPAESSSDPAVVLGVFPCMTG